MMAVLAVDVPLSFSLRTFERKRNSGLGQQERPMNATSGGAVIHHYERLGKMHSYLDSNGSTRGWTAEHEREECCLEVGPSSVGPQICVAFHERRIRPRRKPWYRACDDGSVRGEVGNPVKEVSLRQRLESKLVRHQCAYEDASSADKDVTSHQQLDGRGGSYTGSVTGCSGFGDAEVPGCTRHTEGAGTVTPREPVCGELEEDQLEGVHIRSGGEQKQLKTTVLVANVADQEQVPKQSKRRGFRNAVQWKRKLRQRRNSREKEAEEGVLMVDGIRVVQSSLMQTTFWRFGRWLYSHWFAQENYGLDNLPHHRGAFLLASNHSSHLDCGALFMAAWAGGVKHVYALGARDYFFCNPFKAWFVSNFMHVIPFNRRGFSQREVNILRKIQETSSPDAPAAVVIFPEGTRSKNGALQRFKAGVGFLSEKLDMPVVPVCIKGTLDALPKGRTVPHRHKVEVRFGAPLEMASYLEELAVVVPEAVYGADNGPAGVTTLHQEADLLADNTRALPTSGLAEAAETFPDQPTGSCNVSLQIPPTLIQQPGLGGDGTSGLHSKVGLIRCQDMSGRAVAVADVAGTRGDVAGAIQHRTAICSEERATTTRREGQQAQVGTTVATVLRSDSLHAEKVRSIKRAAQQKFTEDLRRAIASMLGNDGCDRGPVKALNRPIADHLGGGKWRLIGWLGYWLPMAGLILAAVVLAGAQTWKAGAGGPSGGYAAVAEVFRSLRGPTGVLTLLGLAVAVVALRALLQWAWPVVVMAPSPSGRHDVGGGLQPL